MGTISKKILITGGSGFLGRALGVALRERGHDILLVSRSQSALLRAKVETRCAIRPMDLASRDSVEDVFCTFRPNVVVHAGASKHVGLSELEPIECIEINVTGSKNVARSAIHHGCEHVIGISSDKAAAQAMTTYGMTKALMERCLIGLDQQSSTAFTAVRLGNIAWSSGSVFPLWKAMQDQGDEIRSTGPQMRRYFMPINDAVGIVKNVLGHRTALRGKVFIPDIKAAQISHILERWTAIYGGSWTKVPGRLGDIADQWMIGPEETHFAKAYRLEEIDGYLLDFMSQPNPANSIEALSTKNAEQLSDSEIDQLIQPAISV